jgi:4-amino-4-deoxy-L-arabinose transferase-like glycosyltransferase
MSIAFIALFFTVALLVTTAYFLMGGLPLLILDHDSPVDGRFIRRFFEVYYAAAVCAALGACISHALWGKVYFAIGCGAVAVVVLGLRRTIIPAMERLGERIQASETSAIAAFRKVHSAALLLNLAQLILIVWGITQLSFQVGP